MNWYIKSIAHEYMFKNAGKAGDFKITDMSRWVQMHRLISKGLGIDVNEKDIDGNIRKVPPEDIERFMQLSDVIRTLTDKLGRLPRFTSILAEWLKRRPDEVNVIPIETLKLLEKQPEIIAELPKSVQDALPIEVKIEDALTI